MSSTEDAGSAPPPDLGRVSISSPAPAPTEGLSAVVLPPVPPLQHSCVICQRRKVKCNRQFPCSNCVKSRIECTPSIPAPPRRRKRKVPDEEIQAKLRYYRELLKDYGATPDQLREDDEYEPLPESEAEWTRDALVKRPKQSDSGFAPVDDDGSGHGKLVSEKGMSRFLNNNLWTEISDELPAPKEMFHRQSEGSQFDSPMPNADHTDGGCFLLGGIRSFASLASFHPDPVNIFKLWQTFLDNVHPLTKLLHAPTLQKEILEAISNPGKISKTMEALMFAIYLAAVISLDDEECQSKMGGTRSTLVAKYSGLAQQALVRAGFLKTFNMVVLQAFTLFLLAMRQQYDPNTLWVLTGVLVRIAQRLGINRDGASLGLPIFESEMRRRLCWQIMLLDSRSAQLAGTGASITGNHWDMQLPSNLNDSDISPEMKEMPIEHTGLTEMVFCLVRYEVGNFLRGPSISGSGFDGNWHKLSSSAVPLEEKDQLLNNLEERLETRYLKYCDPLIPLHILSTGVARTAISKMRLVAHHPRQYSDGGLSMPQEEKDMLFEVSLGMIESDTLGQATKSMKRFLWHINNYFQLDAFIYMVSELRRRTSGPLVDRAWQQIQQVYDNHVELTNDLDNALYVAIGNLTLKAWPPREAELARQHQQRPQIPHFIEVLRLQRHHQVDIANAKGVPLPSAMIEANGYTREGEYAQQINQDPTFAYKTGGGVGDVRAEYHYADPATAVNGLETGFSPVDWDYWRDLLESNEAYYTEGSERRSKLFGLN